MKNKFSLSWNSSVKPRKQRKWRYFAPIHTRHRLLSSNLSKDLRAKYGRRSFPLRKGDDVKVVVGSFSGKSGKVLEIKNSKLKVHVEGMQRTKKDGTKFNVLLDPSNLMITSLNLEDKARVRSLSKEKTIAGKSKSEGKTGVKK